MAKIEDFGEDFVEIIRNTYGVWRIIIKKKGIIPLQYHKARGCNSQDIIDRVYERYINAYKRNK